MLKLSQTLVSAVLLALALAGPVASSVAVSPADSRAGAAVGHSRHTVGDAPDRGRSRAALGFGRWLDLRIGMTLREARATGKFKHSDICAPWQLRRPWSRQGYTVFIRHRLRFIANFHRGDRTAAGVGRGSTLRQVRAAYLGLSKVRASAVDPGIKYVFVRRHGKSITFQFRYGVTVRPGSRVGDVVVTGRRPEIFYEGC